MKTQSDISPILKDIRAGFENIYGERLSGLYLFGSYARDEAKEDSDIDIAVVLKNEVNQHAEIRRVSEFRAQVSLKYNRLVMPVFLSKEELELEHEPVHRSIKRDGIPL